MFRFFSVFFILLSLLLSCTTVKSIQIEEIPETKVINYEEYNKKILKALSALNLPERISKRIKEEIILDSIFVNELAVILQLDFDLWILIDKQHPINENYIPSDLVKLNNGSFMVNRNDLFLKKEAAQSLLEMASFLKTENITLTVSSAYRSYHYQANLYARYVRELGRYEADRIAARPGYSQHQLGLTVDFGSVTNSFASTREGRWLSANASRFGWSLSYPNGFENVTGYSWESWHYRYVGKEVAAFIDKYFEGIQQYALLFIHEFNLLVNSEE